MHRVRFYQNMANQLEELDKITVAQVDGYCVGGGLEITKAVFQLADQRFIRFIRRHDIPPSLPAWESRSHVVLEFVGTIGPPQGWLC